MQSSEVWKPWPRNPLYQVSNLGNVRGLKGQLLKPILNGHPPRLYRKVNVVGVSDRRHELVKISHMVLETFVGPRPSDRHVCCHWDDDPQNDELSNLRWGTYQDNQLDILRNENNFEANKVVCHRGHRNWKVRKSGHRLCVTCDQARRKARKQRKETDAFKE